MQCRCGFVTVTSWGNYSRAKGCKNCQGSQVSEFWKKNLHPNASTTSMPLSFPTAGSKKLLNRKMWERRTQKRKNNNTLLGPNPNGEPLVIKSKNDMLFYLKTTPNISSNFILPFCQNPGALTKKHLSKNEKNCG